MHPTVTTYRFLWYQPPLQNSNSKTLQLSSLLQIKIKVLVVNCRSIVDKKNEYENRIHSTKPDIDIGTESWLKQTHNYYAIFNPDQGKSPLIGAYYKPHEHDQYSWDESLNKASKLNCNIWVAGDFYLSKIDWELPVSILPGISDHDIVQIQVNISVRTLFQRPRPVSLYKKPYWDGMKQTLDAYHQEMLESGKNSSLNAEHLWDNVQSTIISFTIFLIPSKLSSTRNNLPWVNQKFKRLARERDRAYHKQCKSGKAEYIKEIPCFKTSTQKIHQNILPKLS
ncbi:hypothetical protein MAR_011110 [Mya arenaria]|uniref:Endonuclease/exonuclease/phosphatase domain-containing protein n=1 Tax=Mya arenaria TaxID=6604 RepID=A0ABY7G251_MYAAR|nr:hypothetical protein MAR_011110 [Mya arenaria]